MCRGMFNQGAEIVLTAEPDSGWTHESWIGCDRQDLLGRCTVFMDGDRLVSVTFLSADPLELDDSVVVLRDDQLQGLIDYDLDTGRFVFDAATSDISQWGVGTIMLASEDPNEGLTIARRITGIERNGSQIAFATEQASLEEIFRSGSFSYYGDTDDGDTAAGTLQYPGPTVAQSEDGGRRIPINIDLGGGVRAWGWITFPMEYQIAFNISPLEFRVLAIAKPTASIGLEISGSVMISEDYELWSQRLATIRIPTGLFIPIPVYPTLKIIVEGDAEASASLGVGAEIFVSATAGVHYKNGKLNPVFEADVDPMYRVSSGVDFDLSWNVEVRARGELHFSLLGVAGPYAGVVPYYGISSGCGDSFAETYKGWRVEIGGDLTAIGGPRLELPVRDSSMPHKRISLSRMPSGDSRCQEMPEPDPDPEPDPEPEPDPDPDPGEFPPGTPHLLCSYDYLTSDSLYTREFLGWSIVDGRPHGTVRTTDRSSETVETRTHNASCHLCTAEGTVRYFSETISCSQYQAAVDEYWTRGIWHHPVPTARFSCAETTHWACP